MKNLTLLELRDRLTDIINEHDKRGWSERNNQEIIVSYKISKRKIAYRHLQYAASGSLCINDHIAESKCYTHLQLEDEEYKRY